jgi:hypothetical protein
LILFFIAQETDVVSSAVGSLDADPSDRSIGVRGAETNRRFKEIGA